MPVIQQVSAATTLNDEGGIKDVNNQEAGFGPITEMHMKGMNSVSLHAYTSHA